ncbi:hypothetical protein TcWFU_009876 [Taenia crassiceps]|uniref:Uncharacterized protein n=1 Tax=Taenia crassiceps TaxID=6207 RepID=A0ABR4Q319_9CEST
MLMFQLSLVLMATSILVGEDEGVSGRSVLEAEWFVPNLRWHYVKWRKLRLTWDVQELVDRKVEEMRVRARPAFGVGRNGKVDVGVAHGNVTLEKLSPDTLYSIDVSGYKNGILIFGSAGLIKTYPSDAHSDECTTCMLFPWSKPPPAPPAPPPLSTPHLHAAAAFLSSEQGTRDMRSLFSC